MAILHHPLLRILYIAALLTINASTALLHASENQPLRHYPETIAVLKTLYHSESLAHQRYLAFSRVALKEQHENIAYLFKALAESEAIHASNFKRILISLGANNIPTRIATVQTGSTKANLRFATEVELAEIDTEYPRYLQRIKQENHTEALKYIDYGWHAERQHRELIKQINSATGFFFSMLVKRFRKQSNSYFVNRNCGATVTQLPEQKCPVCHKPINTYFKVTKPT
ncbi:MAG: rubrerythrin family protein [Mariprofundus sp.]|nr:rubrerythrin family protein [Mariprofundus sp.]